MYDHPRPHRWAALEAKTQGDYALAQTEAALDSAEALWHIASELRNLEQVHRLTVG